MCGQTVKQLIRLYHMDGLECVEQLCLYGYYIVTSIHRILPILRTSDATEMNQLSGFVQELHIVSKGVYWATANDTKPN